jgi:hypothetical protein
MEFLENVERGNGLIFDADLDLYEEFLVLDDVGDKLSKMENDNARDIASKISNFLSEEELTENNDEIREWLREKIVGFVEDGDFDSAHRLYMLIVLNNNDEVGAGFCLLNYIGEEKNYAEELAEEQFWYGQVLL